MPPELIPDDEEYASSEDSDFAPDAAPVQDEEEVSSESEAEAEAGSIKTAKPAKRKRGAEAEEAEDAGFENSGDEAIIEKAKKRRTKRKSKKGGKDEDVEDEGGEGGFVKTRTMRAAEKTEKKTALVDTSKATIDVDAMWANMISGKPITPTPIPSTEPAANGAPQTPDPNRSALPIPEESNNKSPRSPSIFNEGPDSMVLIKRTYKFAGKVHTEQKLVPRSSAEAKLYLASQPDPASEKAEQPAEADPSDPFTKPKRPPKKARRSIFEPVTDALPQRKDLHFGVRAAAAGVVGVPGGGSGKERKLNTVEKSAMDWAGFVDKEGIKDELDAAGKAKGAYRARQEFLARVEAKKEEEGRRARGVVI